MNKSVSACPAGAWYAICTMPLFVFCWAYFSTWASTFQHLRTNEPISTSAASIGTSLFFPAHSTAAYFPFIVPPAHCSSGTRTGCGACFIQKGVHFPEPASSATNYDPHELCRTSSETKDVLSRLLSVRFAPVPFSLFLVRHHPFVSIQHAHARQMLADRISTIRSRQLLTKLQVTTISPPLQMDLTSDFFYQQYNHFTSLGKSRRPTLHFR